MFGLLIFASSLLQLILATEDTLLYFDKSQPNFEISLTQEDFERGRYSRFRLHPHNHNVDRDSVLYRRDRFEGDIVGLNIRSILQNQHSTHKGVLRSAVRHRWQTWPSRQVPYAVSSQFSSFSRSRIASALEEYSRRTCVRFVPRTDERDYVFIAPDDGCYSTIGRAGGRQIVSIGAGCVNFGIIIHELMHSVGFFHEQSRPDRDDYVVVNWTNVADDMKDQFIKYNYGMINTLGIAYDYGSVMHYSSRAFTRNGEPTLVPRVNGVRIGQRDGFSQLDTTKINTLYSCDDFNSQLVPPPLEQAQLPDQTVAPISPCIDDADDCVYRKNLGYCESMQQWMSLYCKRTCGVCGDSPSVAITVENREIDPSSCRDDGLYCDSWAKAGFCNRPNLIYQMRKNCKMTCGFCSSS